MTPRYPVGMPIYEFACDACDHRFEELVSASEADGVTCPVCGAVGARRLLSTFQRVRIGAGAGAGGPAPVASGGGCCGGGCGCG